MFSASGNSALGLEDRVKQVKDLTGPTTKLDSNLKPSELQLEFWAALVSWGLWLLLAAWEIIHLDKSKLNLGK